MAGWRADRNAERLARLEEHYARLQQEVGALEEDRRNLTAGPAASELERPEVGLLRRVLRVAVAAVVGGVFAGPLAGPVVTFVLHDPILGKAFEGFMGGLAGAIVSEAQDARAASRENRRRSGERR